MTLHLGIGSWADAAYKKILTAPDLPVKERLKAYSRWFNHVEVNSSYYATPRVERVEEWVADTPPNFTFDIKLHRAFSLSPAKTAANGTLIPLLLQGVQPLISAKKFGAFLLVLAPSFSPENHRLDELDAVAEKLRPYSLAVEMRHSAWVKGKQRDATLDYFKAKGLAWVAVDMPKIAGSTLMPAVDEVTRKDLAYLRLHGRNPEYLAAGSAAARHDYAYSESELKTIVKRVKALGKQASHVHVIANNHVNDFAPKTALALKRLLGA